MQEMRKVVTLLMLGVCAYTDIKERSIYMMSVAAPIGVSVLLCVNAIITSQSECRIEVLKMWLIEPALMSVIVILITSVMKQYIGEGDGYLIAALSTLIGIARSMQVTIAAVVISGLVGAFICLYHMLKHNQIPSSIPFAPSLLVAYELLCLLA